jgi:hypothetical protein
MCLLNVDLRVVPTSNKLSLLDNCNTHSQILLSDDDSEQQAICYLMCSHYFTLIFVIWILHRVYYFFTDLFFLLLLLVDLAQPITPLFIPLVIQSICSYKKKKNYRIHNKCCKTSIYTRIQ